jgi:hypothetical protein
MKFQSLALTLHKWNLTLTWHKKTLVSTLSCGNCDCGRAIPFLGIFVSNFRCWFFAV